MPVRAVITVGGSARLGALVTVTGVVDVASVTAFAEQMWQLLNFDVRLVVVDLTAAIQCDRRLVGVLDQARRRLEQRAGCVGMSRRYGELERQAAQACVGLLDAMGGDDDVHGLATRSTALCVGRLGVDEAAVSLPAREGLAAVVSASSARARQVAQFGLTADEGPVAVVRAPARRSAPPRPSRC